MQRILTLAAADTEASRKESAVEFAAGKVLKVEFAYLKQLPREYSGPRHIVSVSKRPDGRCHYEERPGEAPPNQERSRSKNENGMTIFFVRAQETGNESAKSAGLAGQKAAMLRPEN
jgi:hypothetical protein